jgi:predicted nucleotidyltransferase
VDPGPGGTGIAEELRRRLSRESIAGLVAAYLFGSHTESRPHRESDVDLGVLLDRTRYPTARERFEVRLALAGWVVGAQLLDVVILNDAPPGLAARIVTEGRRIVCADAEAEHAFRRDVQLRAADVRIFLRRMAGIKLDSLRR